MNREEKAKLFETLSKNRGQIPEMIKDMYHDDHEEDDEWVAGVLDLVMVSFENIVYVKVFRMFVDEGFDWRFMEYKNPELFYEFFGNNYVAKTMSYQEEKGIIINHFFDMYAKRKIPKRFECPGCMDFVLLDYVNNYESFINKIPYVSVFSERFLVLVGKETDDVKKALEYYSKKFNVNFGTIYRILDELRTELELAKRRYDEKHLERIENAMKLVFEFYTENLGTDDITLEDFMTIHEVAKRQG